MFFDLFGTLISLLSTYYFIRMDIKAWPIGLLATCFNGWLYWHKGIYADMSLELVYFLSICYGWHQWSSMQEQKSTSLKRLSTKQWVIINMLMITLYIVIYNLLISFTHSTVAKLDALTTSLSLIAQGLMCHKVIATWMFWFVADALYAWMYLCKELSFHAILMIAYTGMAVIGYINWVKNYKPPVFSRLNQKSNVPMV